MLFSRDARALHGHNHDHNCSFTCVKYVKQNAKHIAEKGLGAATNIVCRVLFYVALVLKIVEGAIERVVRVRLRSDSVRPAQGQSLAPTASAEGQRQR